MIKSRHFLLCFFLLLGVMASAVEINRYRDLAGKSSDELMDLGRNYFSKHQNDSAMICFSMVSNRYSEDMPAQEQETMALAFNNLGCVYQYFYFDYSLAYQSLMRAFDIAKQIESEHAQAIVMFNLCELQRFLFFYTGQPASEDLSQLYEDCLDMARKDKNWTLYVSTFTSYTNYAKQVDLEKYRDILGDEIADTVRGARYARYHFQAMENMQRKNYAEARRWFQQQLEVNENQWMPELNALSTYLNIAYTYHLENNTAEAVRQLETALQLAQEKRSSDVEILILQRLSEHCRALGYAKLSNDYRLVCLEKKDSIHQLNNLQSVKKMQLMYDLQKEEREMAKLSESHRKQQRLLFSVSVFLIIILITTVVLFRLNRKLWSSNKSLYDQIHAVMRAEANERRLRNEYEQRLQELTSAEENSPKYSKSYLNEKDGKRLLNDIQDLMSKPEVICQKDFTQAKLAALLNSNTTYVSQVINEQYNMTFSNLLGNSRVKEACRRMDNLAEYGNMTIEAISESVGFRSRVAFFNAFKRETGMSPSDYFRMAKVSSQQADTPLIYQ